MIMKHIDRKKLSVAFLLCLAFGNYTLHAQNSVGIGTTMPNQKAVLDLQSQSQGFLMPRLSTAQRIAINPLAGDDGLLAYDNTLHTFWHWNGNSMKWEPLGGSGATAKGIWQSGSVAPDNSTGQEGDFYLNTTTKELFRKNASGIYNSLVVLGDQFWQSGGLGNVYTNRKVGIGVSNPLRALEVDGGIVSSQLAGSGPRLLVTDNAGEISRLAAPNQAGFLKNDGLGGLSWEDMSAIDYTAGSGIMVDKPNRLIINTGDRNANDDILVGSSAGGDLQGTYPSPTILNNAVTAAKLSDGAVTNAKIADGSVTATKIAPGLAGTQLVTDGSGKVAWVASGVIPLQAGEIAIGAGSGVNNNVVPYQDVTLEVDGKTTVVKLQGNPVNAQYPSANQVLTWNGTEWVAQDVPAPALADNNIWVGSTIGSPVGRKMLDLSLSSTNEIVVSGLQKNPVDNAALSTIDANKVLTWNGSKWVAKASPSSLPAVVLEALDYFTPQTRYYSVDPVDFGAIYGNYHLNYESPQAISARPDNIGEVFMAAPLHLPHGAVIAQLDFSYLDNDSEDMYFSFVRGEGMGTATPLASASSSSASGSYRSIPLTYAETIDNAKYSYKVIVRTKSKDDHRVGRVKVTYTVTKPD